MYEQSKDAQQPTERRKRRPRSKLQMFKESYLPLLIAALALILILVFVIGSISRAAGKNKEEKEASIQASQEAANEAARLQEQAQQLLEEAAFLAEGYDYVGAIAALDSFEGDPTSFAELVTKRAEYVSAQSQMVMWDNISEIPNLSFHLLVADPVRAYADDDYGSSYRNNFITVVEFTRILEQLYANNYILVNLRELVTTTTTTDGRTIYAAKPLYLPEGKKPVILTETNANYYTYMVDGDGDGAADKDGAGFASKLVLDADGKLTNEYIDANGTVSNGAYDLVPILDAFIEAHPDFSLRGAKATIAMSGYDGLLGHRNPADAKNVIEALRLSGYELACYTYGNVPYGSISNPELEADLKSWNEKIAPVVGEVDTLVYALNSDIGDTSAYSGDKYELLKAAGFKFYLASSNNETAWATIHDDYVRQQRILVTGATLTSNPQVYTDFFDAATVMDAARNSD